MEWAKTAVRATSRYAGRMIPDFPLGLTALPLGRDRLWEVAGEGRNDTNRHSAGLLKTFPLNSPLARVRAQRVQIGKAHNVRCDGSCTYWHQNASTPQSAK